MKKIGNTLFLLSLLLCAALVSLAAMGVQAQAAAWQKGAVNAGNTVATSILAELGKPCALDELGVAEIASAMYADTDVVGDSTYLSADSETVRFFKAGTYLVNGSVTVYVYEGDLTPEFDVPAAYREYMNTESILYLALQDGTADLTLGISAFAVNGQELDFSVQINETAAQTGLVSKAGLYKVKLTAVDAINDALAELEYNVRVQYPWVLADFEASSDADLFTMTGGTIVGVTDQMTYNGKNSLQIKPNGRTVYPEFRVAKNGALSLEKYSLTMMVYIEANENEISIFNLFAPDKTGDRTPVLNEWQKITMPNNTTSGTYERFGFLFTGPWVGSGNTTPPATANIYIADVRTTDPAQNLAGAPIREVKCTGDQASEFDLTTLVTQNGTPASGTVTNDAADGTVSYKEGSDNTVLLVKAGESYTFTSDAGGTASIRGTAKDENMYLIPADGSAELDLVTIEGAARWGSSYGVYSAWDAGALDFTIRFQSDGLIDSTKARRLSFRVTVTSTDPNTLQATPIWNGTAGALKQTSRTSGSEVFSFDVAAGAAISDLAISFHKTSTYANILINSFYVEVTDGSTLDGVNLTKASFGSSSMPDWLAASNLAYNSSTGSCKLYNAGSDGVLQPSLTFTCSYEQSVRVYFTVSQASVGEGTFTYTMTTNKEGVTVTNAENSNVYTLRAWTTGNPKEFWFDVENGSDLSSLTLSMTKNTGWANIFVDSIRIVPLP